MQSLNDMEIEQISGGIATEFPGPTYNPLHPNPYGPPLLNSSAYVVTNT
jgi:hypothetical protein